MDRFITSCWNKGNEILVGVLKEISMVNAKTLKIIKMTIIILKLQMVEIYLDYISMGFSFSFNGLNF